MNTCNIAELMLNDDVNKLLALCTPEQKAPPVGASDYDRFLQLCRCLPLFYGHAVLPSAQEYLKRYFDSDLPIIPQNAAKLWHLTAERLLCMGEAIPPFPINEQTKPVLLPPLSDGKIYTELAVKVLAQTHADTWCAWREEMRTRLDWLLSEDPLRFLRMDLFEPICLQRPALYHVEQALQRKKRTSSDCAILDAQVLRFVCEYAQLVGVGVTLHLYTPQAVGLLAHYHREIGLARMLCVVYGAETQDAVIAFLQSTDAPITLALDRSAFSSQDDFLRAATVLAAKYPLGCLTVLEEHLKKRFLLP